MFLSFRARDREEEEEGMLMTARDDAKDCHTLLLPCTVDPALPTPDRLSLVSVSPIDYTGSFWLMALLIYLLL